MIYTLTLNPALDRELTVPEIEFNQVLRAQSIQIDYGGKGFNVSRALLAMGIESTALGFIGGPVGEQLIAGLSQLGILVDFIRIRGDTRINLSIVNANHSHYVKVNETGPWVSEAEAKKMLKRIATLAKPGDQWVLAGSSPQGIDASFIAEVVRLVQAAGGRMFVDMEGDCLYQACINHAFLVSPNQSEASALIGRPILDEDQAAVAACILHDLGAEQVVVSMGKAGAVYFDGKRIWYAQPPHIDEKNPIGAGDAMLAGILWAFQNHISGGEILSWGVACGAASASLDGTAVGSTKLVQSLFRHVIIQEVAH